MSQLLCSALVALLIAAPLGAQELRAEFIAASTAPLDNPHDLKLSPDGQQLFVSDVGNNRVVILDAETLNMVGSFGADHQAGTHDVDFDQDGRAYVADTHNNRVTIYEQVDGKWQLVGELKGGFRGPEGVLVHANGRVYVSGAWSNNVVMFEHGELRGELTGLASPHDVEQASTGDIWLSDAGNDRLLLLSPDLAVVRELKGSPYDFDGVRYQDVLPDGTVIAADKNSHRVLVIGPDGAIRATLGSGEAGRGPGRFRTPEGVEVRGDTVWLSDSGNDRVVVYRLNGL